MALTFQYYEDGLSALFLGRIGSDKQVPELTGHLKIYKVSYAMPSKCYTNPTFVRYLYKILPYRFI
jgi:hypothetical protein